jgi:CheY-like chemotaxis protein
MLRTAGLQPAMEARALESLERNARAQAQLVEDLLDVSRIMSGKLQIRMRAVGLAGVVTNAVDTVRLAAVAKNLLVNVRLPDAEAVTVTADPDRLQQIVWNLLSNAVKFTPNGGRIDVTLRRIDDRAEIVVSDTGQGIPRSFLAHVFERFRQSDASTARHHGGLGLGLSIVRHLTEAHGGTVTAESGGEDQGATFRMTLPLRPDHALDPGDPGLDVAMPAHSLTGARVLVVDDHPDARELACYALARGGAQVSEATDVAVALELLTSATFDVVVADIGMPGQDGYTLIRAMRSAPEAWTRRTPAIALTAYASERERERAIEAGFSWHLAKPVDPDHLVATVAMVRARYEASN